MRHADAAPSRADLPARSLSFSRSQHSERPGPGMRQPRRHRDRRRGSCVVAIRRQRADRPVVRAQHHRGRHRPSSRATTSWRRSRCSSPASRSPRRWGATSRGYSRDFVCQSCACSTEPLPRPRPQQRRRRRSDRRATTCRASRRAVESYEYSKQPMNNIAFESGAGTSLALRARAQPEGRDRGRRARGAARLGPAPRRRGSNATSRVRSRRRSRRTTRSGWPGFWPTLQPFTQWNPSIKASNASTGCSISSDDDPGATGSLACNDYECDYTTLHLPEPRRAGER